MESREIIDKNGRAIRLESIAPYEGIRAFHLDQEIGGFEFHVVDDGIDSFLKVMNMHLNKVDGFKRCGIGTAIIEWAEDWTGLQILFGSDDGSVQEDGSHLTGDGLAFASSIKNR